MSTLKLVRSGGFAGKSFNAETTVDMTENDLYDALKEIEAESNSYARDAFSYTAHIGDEPKEDGVKIDPGKAKGKLKKAIDSLMASMQA